MLGDISAEFTAVVITFYRLSPTKYVSDQNLSSTPCKDTLEKLKGAPIDELNEIRSFSESELKSFFQEIYLHQ